LQRFHRENLLARVVNTSFNTAYALGVPRYALFKSIFGDSTQLWKSIIGGSDPARFKPFPDFAFELDAVKPERGLSRYKTLARLTLSFPGARHVIGVPSGPQPLPNGGAHPDGERWFFMNGVCADPTIAEFNRFELSRFSGRPVQLLYNATDGVLFDLLECALGKTFNAVTEAAAPNLEPLVDALKDEQVNRVIFLSHSQGTIIAAVLLKIIHETLSHGHEPVPVVGTDRVSGERFVAREMSLHPNTIVHPSSRGSFLRAIGKLKATPASVMDKLEIYCFANCATSMTPFISLDQPKHRAPWIESYGNENDIVARLGVLASSHGVGSSRIDGDRYYRTDAWGHMLNAHYLAPMYEALTGEPEAPAWYPFPENLRTSPRLWEYRDGGLPDPHC